MMTKLWSIVVCCLASLLGKVVEAVVGPIGDWPVAIAVGIAAFVPGILCLFVARFLLSVANRRSSKQRVPPECRKVGILLVMCFGACTSPAFAQCDPPLPPPPPPGGGVLLYSLNGQTVEADGLGDFFIPNVAAPDVFPTEFVGDDLLFLTLMRITDEGTTHYYTPTLH